MFEDGKAPKKSEELQEIKSPKTVEITLKYTKY
jgi:hypothetical protein